MDKNILNSFFKRVFSVCDDIQEFAPYKKVYFLGFKISLDFEHTWLHDMISKQILREVYSALDVQYLHSKVFPQFKNINKGKNVTIVGCGPTLNYYNNEADFVNIALNKAILLDNIKFSYSFAVDRAILKTCPNYMDIIMSKDCIKFLGKNTCPEVENFPEILFDEKDNVYRFYSANRNGVPAKKFGEIIYPNIETHPLCDFDSISFSALHFALYTHPEKIYLVGLDTSQCGHFFGDDGYTYNIKKMIRGYRNFKKFAEIFYPDTEIISVNPVGLKGIFTDVYTQNFVSKNNLSFKDLNIISKN